MWKFAPILKTTLWGGDKIIPFKGINARLSHVGESWEISGVEGSESVVEEGPDNGLTLTKLIDRYGAALVGKRNYTRFGNRFPLLVKFIDAASDLSVQVHPDDEMARRRGALNGKSEVWYVLSSGKDGKIAAGFNEQLNPGDIDRLLEEGKIEEKLRYIKVQKGDVYHIPAGRVHALGASTMVVEIQQTSDDTYRLYDYRRKDADGKERELHVDLAREAIDYNDTEASREPFKLRMDVPTTVVKTPQFCMNLLVAENEIMRDYRESDTFMVLVCAEGEAGVTCGNESMLLRQGNSVLIPASATSITIVPKKKVTIIETYVP